MGEKDSVISLEKIVKRQETEVKVEMSSLQASIRSSVVAASVT